MIVYLAKDPLRLDETGELLLCDDSFLHDHTEPISPAEIQAINTYLDKKVLKPVRPWRKLTRDEAVEIIKQQLKLWE